MHHGETHIIILPHAVMYNEPGAKDAIPILSPEFSVRRMLLKLYSIDVSKFRGAGYVA
jgi:hypothetical protein